ncbi:hypothetical protein, partial [Methanosarcina mazei]|uniref:hypothetical protein n=1 Tax=Methanosarcina mazei TaxID=2209 RepID=UPI001F1622DC
MKRKFKKGFVTIQPLIKKYVFSAKCCNSQDNSGAPLSAARIASITFKPFFLIVETVSYTHLRA